MKRFLVILGLALLLGIPTSILADSLNVRMIGSVDTPGAGNGIALWDTFAYVADAESGLRIINISNPTSPFEVGVFDVAGLNAQGVAILDTFAYVADWTLTRLRIINISNPSSPSQTGFLNIPGSASNVAVSRNGGMTFAYVAGTAGGLRIIEVTVPSSPTEVGFFDTPGTALGIAILDTFAYVADADSGLRIINIANPASPVEVGFTDTPGLASGVFVLDTFAYVADWGSGLRIINVADPSSPFEVGFFDTPSGLSVGVTVSGNLAYLGDGGPGLRIFDVSDPTSPMEVGYYDGLGMNFTFETALQGGYIYTVDRDTGLVVLEYYGVGVEESDNAKLVISNAKFKLLQNSPNPFYSSTLIRYSLPVVRGQGSGISDPTQVKLTIYDLSGRLIETLVNDRQEPGVYQVQWEGKDQPSGVYFYMLKVRGLDESSPYMATKKLIILR